MATVLWSPDFDAWTRARALGSLVKIVIDVRLVTGLLTAVWLTLNGTTRVALFLVFAVMAMLLLLLLRWERIGPVVIGHPLVLGADAVLCFTTLYLVDPFSPYLLVVASGGLLTGLCLGTRGACVFGPLYAVGWFVASAGSATVVQDQFLSYVVIPGALVSLLFAGSAFRSVILRAAEAEERVRVEMRTSAAAEERARLAREMHDSVTKSLHGIGLLAEALPAYVERAPERAVEQARQVSRAAIRATEESRELLVAMRRSSSTATFDEALTELTDRWSVTSGRQIRSRLHPTVRLGPGAMYEACAIVAEALENVDRHTPEAMPATVTLEVADGWVEVCVADDGPGFDADRTAEARLTGHYGVLGMKERAARIGALLTITSPHGTGTQVSLRIPYDSHPTSARSEEATP